jgi:hypothetical protein
VILKSIFEVFEAILCYLRRFFLVIFGYFRCFLVIFF